MKEDSEKQKKAIWHKWQQKTGIPLTHTEWDDFRKGIEVAYQGHDPDIDLEDLDGAIEYILTTLLSAPYFPKPKEKPTGVCRHYQKTLQRRLYLVDFVLRKHINLNNIIDRDISKRERIHWNQLIKDWNKANPSNPMTKKVFKDTFYRSIKEPEIQEAFWGKLDDDMKQVFAPLFNQANSAFQRMSSMMLKIANVLSPEDLKVLREYELRLQDTVDMLTPTEQGKQGEVQNEDAGN